MKKNDYKLIAAVLLAALVMSLAWGTLWKRNASVVEVTVNGKRSGTYRLAAEQTIRINDTNTLVIRDGVADMTDANCPDKLCVNQKAISKNGESIVCLPNKIIVTVNSDKEGKEDIVVH